MPIGPRGWRRVVPDAREEAARPARVEPAAGTALPAAAPAAEASAVESAPSSRIERGCEMSGTLALARPLVIEGEFSGSIACESSVVVTESGSVEASIRARSVVIRGAVVGDVSASREVVIHAGARLHGDVETPSLVVERGAFFNGATRMYRPEHALRAAAAATATAP
jgi:cytoskeletal protein CcmA (bactofilin family)